MAWKNCPMRCCAVASVRFRSSSAKVAKKTQKRKKTAFGLGAKTRGWPDRAQKWRPLDRLFYRHILALYTAVFKIALKIDINTPQNKPCPTDLSHPDLLAFLVGE